MKKNHILFLIVLLFSSITKAQTATDVVTGLSQPRGLLLNGNDLYIAEYIGDKISKIDITATTPTATDVVAGLSGPTGLVLNGNDLFISESSSNKISKIDITATTPTATDVVTGLSEPAGLLLNGNDLYIAELNGNKISKIDITSTTPTAIDVVTGLNDPIGLVLNGNDLYIAEVFGNKISKFNISTLSINENILKSKVQLYPNPSNKFIQVSGLTTKENYKIYNILYTEVKNGSISNQEEIDIKSFTNGLYLLKFDNGNTLKFIKE